MNKNEPVTFKVEGSMWQVMKLGRKTWDGRQIDMSDERFQRLHRGHWEDNSQPGRQPFYVPDEVSVCFLNKDTGQTLHFRFRGLIHMNWAPGWCFLLLGGLIATFDSNGTIINA